MIMNAKIRELKYSIHLAEVTVKGAEQDLAEYRDELARLNNELQAELALASGSVTAAVPDRRGRYAGPLVIAS